MKNSNEVILAEAMVAKETARAWSSLAWAVCVTVVLIYGINIGYSAAKAWSPPQKSEIQKYQEKMKLDCAEMAKKQADWIKAYTAEQSQIHIAYTSNNVELAVLHANNVGKVGRKAYSDIQAHFAWHKDIRDKALGLTNAPAEEVESKE